MGPKKEEAAPSHLAFRASPELTARIERLAGDMSEKLGGVEISKTAVLKMLVEKALPAFEVEYTKAADDYSLEQTKDVLKLIADEAQRQKFLEGQLRGKVQELRDLSVLHRTETGERDKDE
jgi:hypothetical protein